MSAAERLHLEGKDWFTEAEAAEYCGVALSTFREGYRALGISPRRAFGHRAEIQYGCGDPEICLRCRQLLSTAYSRAKEPTP